MAELPKDAAFGRLGFFWKTKGGGRRGNSHSYAELRGLAREYLQQINGLLFVGVRHRFS